VSTTNTNTNSPLGIIAAVWGVGGVILILGSAIVRLTPIAWTTIIGPLEWWHIVFGVVWTIFMAYSEGYRGFQRAFSPRVVARAQWLSRNPSLLHVLLAPLFCMAFFHATRKRLIVSWAITMMVIFFIIGAKLLPDPWRGLVDIGVVVGLTWGLAAILGWCIAGLRGVPLPCPPDVPLES